MKTNEVRKLIEKENMKDFNDFMKGQTVDYENGQVDYYDWDVKKFMRLKGIEGELK